MLRCTSKILKFVPTTLTTPQDAEIQAQLRDADPNREAQLLESWKAYKKGFQEGIALFNKKPKKGVAYMQARPLAAPFQSLHQAG